MIAFKQNIISLVFSFFAIWHSRLGAQYQCDMFSYEALTFFLSYDSLILYSIRVPYRLCFLSLGIGSSTAFSYFGRFRDWFGLFRRLKVRHLCKFIAFEKILARELIPRQLRTKCYEANGLPLS